jgi:hypothetical protein
MRREAKLGTVPRHDQEQCRHDIARRAWSDEPTSVVQRLETGVIDLQSRLRAESLVLDPQPALTSRLRARIDAARELICLLGTP